MAPFDACLRLILCALSNAAVAALSLLIDAALLEVEADRALLQAELAELALETAGAQRAVAFARTAVGKTRAAANLVPFGTIAGCADLGSFMVNLNRTVDRAAAELNQLLNTASRVLAFQEELAARLADLDVLVEQFQAIKNVLGSCAGGVGP